MHEEEVALVARHRGERRSAFFGILHPHARGKKLHRLGRSLFPLLRGQCPPTSPIQAAQIVEAEPSLRGSGRNGHGPITSCIRFVVRPPAMLAGHPSHCLRPPQKLLVTRTGTSSIPE